MDPKPRGFAAMSPERRRELAKLGGQSVPPHKRSFSTKKGLAEKAGAVGGRSVSAEKRLFKKDPSRAIAAVKKRAEKKQP